MNDDLQPPERSTPVITAVFAERIIAGCLLHGPDAVDAARAVLTADDFGTYPPRLIFGTAGRLRDAGERIDAATVLMTLTASGKAADLGPNPTAYLAGLLDDAPTPANLSLAAARVRDAAARRSLIRLAAELVEAAHNPDETASEVATRHAQQVAALAAQSLTR